MKTCSKCSRPEGEVRFGRGSVCNPCLALARRQRYKEDPSKAKKSAAAWRSKNPSKHLNAHRKRLYGVDNSWYQAQPMEQGGGCAICGGTPSGHGRKRDTFCIDHDHETGKVRGLLCHHCNLVLGYARDRIENLAKAISYLKRFK